MLMAVYGMRNAFFRILGWLPCVLLVVVASNHFMLVRTQHLAPWLGGGFGMFASTDVGSTRWIAVTAVSENGDEHRVPLKGQLRDLKYRARNLPNASQLDALAQAVWKKLEKDAIEETESPPASLAIEVWKTRYHAKSLQPEQIQLALEYFDFKK